MSNDFLNINFDAKKVSFLAKSYNTLDYYVKIIDNLKILYPEEYLSALSKYELHKILNDVIYKNYNGEEILKYNLAKKYLCKKSYIGAFEMKVNKSRIDFLAINGISTSFEIKTGLDTLSKVKKQVNDYIHAFEYNYIVIDQSHLVKVNNTLPKTYGIIVFEEGRFRLLQKSKKSIFIDPKFQLEQLTKKELTTVFPNQKGVIKNILKSYSKEEINRVFKRILKQRYKTRWNFLNSNIEKVLPLDVQFFFNNNIKPEIVYSI